MWAELACQTQFWWHRSTSETKLLHRFQWTQCWPHVCETFGNRTASLCKPCCCPHTIFTRADGFSLQTHITLSPGFVWPQDHADLACRAAGEAWELRPWTQLSFRGGQVGPRGALHIASQWDPLSAVDTSPRLVLPSLPALLCTSWDALPDETLALLSQDWLLGEVSPRWLSSKMSLLAM